MLHKLYVLWNLEHSEEKYRIYVIFQSTVLEQRINVQQVFICVIKYPTAIVGIALIHTMHYREIFGRHS